MAGGTIHSTEIGLSAEWIESPTSVGRGSGVLAGTGDGVAVGTGGGVGVSGRGVDVAVGARETAGTGVEVEDWLTVSEPPQATAKMSAAPISVRRMREKVAASGCPLPAWMMGGA